MLADNRNILAARVIRSAPKRAAQSPAKARRTDQPHVIARPRKLPRGSEMIAAIAAPEGTDEG